MSYVQKGIILAGGSGTRLFPLTKAISKQLLPVYDKPLIYYPLSTLMLSGIREILIITTLDAREQYKNLLGNGRQLGIDISYKIQDEPRGLPEAFTLGEEFMDGQPVCLILGDNIFHSNKLINTHIIPNLKLNGATIFGYRVNDPQRYGVIELDGQQHIKSIEEKPSEPKSNLAITGLYLFDQNVCEIARALRPSKRNELEIVDVIKHYQNKNSLTVEVLGRGIAWLDTGTHEAMLTASTFVEILEKRQGLKIACIEEIAYQQNWITKSDLWSLIAKYPQTDYRRYIESLL